MTSLHCGCISGHKLLALCLLLVICGRWSDNSWICAIEGSLVIINQSGRDVEVDCGELQGTIFNGERAVVAEVKDKIEQADNILEWIRANVLGEFFTPPTACRLEAGNCFVVWHPAFYDTKGQSHYGRFEWEVDQIGLLLPFAASKSVGDEYAMLWQMSNDQYSSVPDCMSSDEQQPRLADAFYSLFFFYRE